MRTLQNFLTKHNMQFTQEEIDLCMSFNYPTMVISTQERLAMEAGCVELYRNGWKFLCSTNGVNAYKRGALKHKIGNLLKDVFNCETLSTAVSALNNNGSVNEFLLKVSLNFKLYALLRIIWVWKLQQHNRELKVSSNGTV